MSLVSAGTRIFAGRVGQVAANAAVVVLVAQRLGPAGQGHYSLTVAVTLLAASLLGGGMGLAAVPALRQGRVRPQRLMRAQFLWMAAMSLVFGAAAQVAVSGDAAAAWFAAHLGWTPEVGRLAAAGAFGMMGFEIFTYNLLARGRLVVGSAINGWRAFGHLLLVAALLAAGRLTLTSAVAAFAVAQVGGLVAIIIVALRDLRRAPASLVTAGRTASQSPRRCRWATATCRPTWTSVRSGGSWPSTCGTAPLASSRPSPTSCCCASTRAFWNTSAARPRWVSIRWPSMWANSCGCCPAH
ncbi:MAG: hypothetical protein IPP62_12400 [bacterium]|nr:hypothetical protein [bacterium]